MQQQVSISDYLQSLVRMVNENATTVKEPFAVFAPVENKNGKVFDLMAVGFNPAFKNIVDPNIYLAKFFSDFAPPRAVKYWLAKYALVKVSGKPLEIDNYITTTYKKKFLRVQLIPMELFGATVILTMFIGPTPKGQYCDACKNNPLSEKPRIKMAEVKLDVHDGLNINNCEACQKLTLFLDHL